MAKWYGSIDNRLAEGHKFLDRDLRAGDDITMYFYSDRACYYITKVIDQKHIFVKQYEVVADRDLPGGEGHQNWKYFKTAKECNEYLKKYGLGSDENPLENPEQEWVFRYNHWCQATHYTKKTWETCLKNAEKDCKNANAVETLARFYLGLSDKDFEKILTGKEVVKYHKLEPISFGIRDYYYDWSF